METDEVIYSRYLTEHNESDFRVLLERHKDSLLLFLMSFVHNEDDAEELMLDTYAEVAASSSFRGRSSFKTWLFAIGKKKALMQLRKHKWFFSIEDDQAEIPSSPPSVELDILKEERNRHLYEALNKLNQEYRQVLILLYFEEMSHEEVERVMGKSRKQVYNLAERSRKALKEELERIGYNDAQYE
ncbi:MAG: sigma-70 family RNA polymerase sigma factor [Clostridiales bacterium]|nr:sigma-70 family RNA polymerase sigma factor [Candidatus Scatonaster coprocaballi]